jgi:hypothetical protein
MAWTRKAGIASGRDLASAMNPKSAFEAYRFNEKNPISAQAEGELSRSLSSPIRTMQERLE